MKNRTQVSSSPFSHTQHFWPRVYGLCCEEKQLKCIAQPHSLPSSLPSFPYFCKSARLPGRCLGWIHIGAIDGCDARCRSKNLQKRRGKWAGLARQPVLFSFGLLSLSSHPSIPPVWLDTTGGAGYSKYYLHPCLLLSLITPLNFNSVLNTWMDTCSVLPGK